MKPHSIIKNGLLDNARELSRAFLCLAIMIYQQLCHALKYSLRILIFLGRFSFYFISTSLYFRGVFNKTVIILTLVRYKKITAKTCLWSSC